MPKNVAAISIKYNIKSKYEIMCGLELLKVIQLKRMWNVTDKFS
jgi:hypothetical protein